MSCFGKVLNLLDERYLNLQDVTGKLEPLPTLVPLEDYDKNAIVYQTNTSHEITMGIIQDLTAHKALETGEELWTWCAQWEVNDTPSHLSRPSKKSRFESVRAVAQPRQYQTPAMTIFERRVLDPALMKEEDMQRILIDIVQVDSSLVPNFIEFLYRWVDFYEGDGMALRAALKCEIPSLWDFEFHPLLLPASMQKDAGAKPGESKTPNGVEGSYENPTHNAKVEELAQSSPTKKMRSKPNLAAIERQTLQTEESQRLQYREVRYGIQPPRMKQRLPPLINIPQDSKKRIKYYAACFKSRHRAICLLQEAGITIRQIANYQKLQLTHPQQTSDDPGGEGLRHYEKDMQFAQMSFEAREQLTKQREIAISNKLAVEALLAARTAVSEDPSGVPLIPPTPSYQRQRRPDMAAAMMRRIQAARKARPDRIATVPLPLVGRMKSRLFEGAQDLETVRRRKATTESDEHGDEDEDDDDIDLDIERLITRPLSTGSTTMPPVPSLLQPSWLTGARPQTAIPAPGHPPAATRVHNLTAWPSNANSTTSVHPNVSSGVQLSNTGSNTGSTASSAHTLPPPGFPAGFWPPSTVSAPTQSPSPTTNGIGGQGFGVQGPWSTTIATHTNTSQHITGNLYHHQGQPSPAGNPTPTPALGTVPIQNRPALPQLSLPPLPPLNTTLALHQGPPSQQNHQPSTTTQPGRPLILAPPPPRPAPLRLSPPSRPPLSRPVSLPQPAPAKTLIQIYLPGLLVPHRSGTGTTDVLLLGYTDASAESLVLTHALYLPVAIRMMERVQEGRATVLEAYGAGCEAHKTLWKKVRGIWGMMGGEEEGREERVTKRWRAGRGAVWEGYGIVVDRAVEMKTSERAGCVGFRP